jgi:hypothetical protein
MEDAEFLSRVFFKLRKIRFTDSHLYNYFYNVNGVTKSKENVYRNIVDLTRAGERIKENLARQGIYEEHAGGFTRMQCLGIINKLSLLSKESIGGIKESVDLCVRNETVCKYFSEVNVDGFSPRIQLFIHLINAKNTFLLSALLKLKGFRNTSTGTGNIKN